eukprot:gene8653-9534_t
MSGESYSSNQIIILIKLFIVLAAFSSHTVASEKYVSTYAGWSSSADMLHTGEAQAVTLVSPRGVYEDSQGNLFLAEATRIHKIAARSNYLTLYAGGGYSTVNGVSALEGLLGSVWSLGGDRDGVIFYTEHSGCRVQSILPSNMTLHTVAGSFSKCSYSGDGGLAINARVNHPAGLFYDPLASILYFADSYNHVIRAVDRVLGNISTVVGFGSTGFLDNVSPLLARLNTPLGVWVNTTTHDVYIADYGNCRIRLFDRVTNNVTTLAGNGSCNYNGEMPGLATSMALNGPTWVCGSAPGDLFFSTDDRSGLYKMNLYQMNHTGEVERIMGNQSSLLYASSVPATSVRMGYSYDCSIGPTGDLIVADYGEGFVWRISPSNGMLTAVVGYVSGVGPLPATSIAIKDITSIFANTWGDLFVADAGEHRIHYISSSSDRVSVYAGSGVAGYNGDNIKASLAALNRPSSVVGDYENNLYIAEGGGNRVRFVQPGDIRGFSSDITTVVGTGVCAQDCYFSGMATSFSLCSPSALAIDNVEGALYVADGAFAIRKFNLNTLEIAPWVGSCSSGFLDGNLMRDNVLISSIYAMWMDESHSILYFADAGNMRIRYVDIPAEDVGTLIGNGTQGYLGENTFINESLIYLPTGICQDSAGAIYIVQTSGSRVLKIDRGTNRVTTVAGSGFWGLGREGIPALATNMKIGRGCAVTHDYLYVGEYLGEDPSARPTHFNIAREKYVETFVGRTIYNVEGRGDGDIAQGADLSAPVGIFEDSVGDLYVTEFNVIRRVAHATSRITTFVGGGNGFEENIPASETDLLQPWGVTGDTNGNIYYSDYAICQVRVVQASSMLVRTVVGYASSGNWSCNYTGDGSYSIYARLNNPAGLFYVAADNTLYIADSGNHCIRMVDLTQMIISTVVGIAGEPGYVDNVDLPLAKFDTPMGVYVNRDGDLFVADSRNCGIRKVSMNHSNVTTVAVSQSCDALPAPLTPVSVCGDPSSGSIYYTIGTTGLYFANLTDNHSWEKLQISGMVANNLSVATGIPPSSYYLGFSFSCWVKSPRTILAVSYSTNNLISINVSANRVDVLAGFVSGVTIPRTSASFPAIRDLWTDTAGDVYLTTGAQVSRVSHLLDTISVVAGNGMWSGFNGDNIPATLASLSTVNSIGGDSAGNIYMGDSGLSRVRKVALSSGFITTIAGNGLICQGSRTYQGPATDFSFCAIRSMALDSDNGTLFVMDLSILRKIDLSSGHISIIGGGGSSINPLGQAATSARFGSVSSMMIFGQGDLLLLDTSNYRIWRLNVKSGWLSSFAGTGDPLYNTEDLPATSSPIFASSSICANNEGDIFITTYAGRVMRISASTNRMQTYVGNGTLTAIGGEMVDAMFEPFYRARGCCIKEGNLLFGEQVFTTTVPQTYRVRHQVYSRGDGDIALGASIFAPRGVYVDSVGDIFLAESTLIRKISKEGGGIISTVAGGGELSRDHISATNAHISVPYALTGDSQGNIYFSDYILCQVRVVSNTGIISTVVGYDANCTYIEGEDGHRALFANLNSPTAVFFHTGSHALYIADSGNNRIRLVNFNTRLIQTLVGSGLEGFDDSDDPKLASLSFPTGLFVDDRANVYIADSGNCAIRMYNVSSGKVITVYKSAVPCWSIDRLSAYDMMSLCGINSTLYYSLGNNEGLWELDPLVGESVRISGDSSSLLMISGIDLSRVWIGQSDGCYVETSGNITISTKERNLLWRLHKDPEENRYRTEAVIGVVPGISVPPRNIIFSSPAGVWANSMGDIYIADTGSYVLYVYSHSTQLVSVVAGTYRSGYNGENIAASLAAIGDAGSVTGDVLGNIYYAESRKGRIRKIDKDSRNVTSIINKGNLCSSSSYSGPVASLSLCFAHCITLDKSGDVMYIADQGVIRKLVLSTGWVNTTAGSGSAEISNGLPLTSIYLSNIYSMAFSDDNIMYLAEKNRNRLLAANLSSNTISIFAGNGKVDYNAEDLPATESPLASPQGICIDEEENVYAIGSYSSRISVIRSATHRLQTYAGNGSNDGIGAIFHGEIF